MANLMVRETNTPGTVMKFSRVPIVGELIKTSTNRELKVRQVVHTPNGSCDAEIDVD